MKICYNINFSFFMNWNKLRGERDEGMKWVEFNPSQFSQKTQFARVSTLNQVRMKEKTKHELGRTVDNFSEMKKTNAKQPDGPATDCIYVSIHTLFMYSHFKVISRFSVLVRFHLELASTILRFRIQ